jgi:hypothetical protein
MQFENTYRLEGSIQGPLPAGPDGRSVIEKLTREFNRNGLRLNLRYDDFQFALSAETEIRDTEEIQPREVDLMLQNALEQLLAVYPQELRMRVFSCLRSWEYQPGTEIQSAYVIVYPGQVKVERRKVAADVVPRPGPVSVTNKVGYIVGAVAILALLGWGSASLVTYRDLGEQKLSSYRGTRLEDLTVNDKALLNFVRVVDVDVEKSPVSIITLNLRKGTKWPDDITPLPRDSQGYTPSYRTAFKAAIEDRQLTVILRDDKGEITTSKISLQDFFEDDKREIIVKIPYGTKVVRELILRP